MRKLQETAELFEVSVPEYKQLRQCRTAIVLLKSVWDMVIFLQVRSWTYLTFTASNVKTYHAYNVLVILVYNDVSRQHIFVAFF